MELPRVSPVGVLESPASFEAAPRRYPRGVRALAASLVLAFLAVATAGTVLTLGAYCLTSHAGVPAPFAGSPAPR